MKKDLPQSMGRRNLFKGAAAAGVVSVFQAWNMSEALAAKPGHGASPYGPVAPVRDLSTGLELLQLPQGFQYRSFSWTGDPMANGQPVPGAHDGMAVVREGVIPGIGAATLLIRNHELGLGELIAAPGQYDAVRLPGGHAAGGNTLLVFRGRQWVETSPALGGTLTNCAGGPTPWGTWLTCEETMTDLTAQGGKKHGYVFEVRTDQNSTGQPIVDMGRMSHEAVAIDPDTGTAYLTEDNRNMSGLYRFLPNDVSGAPGSLERGGRLQAARVIGVPKAELNVAAAGQSFDIDWVDVPAPDANPAPMPMRP